MMRTWTIGVMALALAVGASYAEAQPGAGMGGGRPGGRGGAEFFLAHTGDLKLTDIQVTRLAAIARRTEDRRRALRASMDSAGPMRMNARPDSAAHIRMMERMRTTMDRERDQSRTDLRDALSVLTPEQLATAWEMGPPGGRGGPDGEGGMRQRQMREHGGRGMRRMEEGERGPDGPRRPAGTRPEA